MGKKSSLSKSRTILEMSNFWNKHDVSEFNNKTYRVRFDVELRTKKEYVALLPEIVEKISEYARACGTNVDTLVNTWLQQKINTLSRKTK